MQSGTDTAESSAIPATRVPLIFPPGFSWKAVAFVMAEKFGLRGLRISAMIGFMIGYFWWRGCDGFICTVLYIAAAGTIGLLVLVAWTAKESLDKFQRDHAENAWLTLDDEGVGGEAVQAGTPQSFKMPWTKFRRIKERQGMWLLETSKGAWMVLPTTHFTGDAWAHLRQRRRTV